MAKKTSPDTLVKEILEKIDKVTDETRKEMVEMRKDVSSLANTAVEQQVILKEHMRRTEANEASLKILADTHAINAEKISNRIAPLEAHISMWAGAWKVLATLAAIATIAGAAWKVVETFIN